MTTGLLLLPSLSSCIRRNELLAHQDDIASFIDVVLLEFSSE